jgi:demethoxyubiquinone hydroxylase (CLK1/Coq7/Cat5 family)
METSLFTQQLATVVYIHAMRKEIEEEVKSKYSKRIDYLVNANNELMKELEQCESEIVTVEKECYGRGV